MTKLSPEPVVAVTGGKVQGALEDDVCVFRGLPFAAPIAGANRWRAPQAVAAWDGVRPATRFGQACPQSGASDSLAGRAIRLKATGRVFFDAISDLGAPTGDDCLNLNVWTTTLDPDARLPVLVFIHGGSLTTGSGAQPIYDGTALARAGLVVVTINYRLGVMGFIGGDDLFPDGLGAANRGFLDQVRALEWVAQNIKSFGGDPDCVTISGESAGAASVLMLAASPMAAGLFRRAISLSGAPLAHAQAEVSAFAADVFARLGVQRGDGAALAALPAARALDAGGSLRQLLAKDAARYGTMGAEGLATYAAAIGSPFLPEPPVDLVARRTDLDLMVGTCADEGRLWSIMLPLPDAIASRVMFGQMSGIMNPPRRPAETFAAYRQLMPGASGVRVRERAITDAMFRRPSVAFAKAVARGNPGHGFLYRFDWPAPALNGALRATHGVDIPCVFQTYDAMAEFVGPASQPHLAGDALHAAVVSFAKTGAPAIPGGPAWPAYDAADEPCMLFDDVCTLARHADAPFDAIW